MQLSRFQLAVVDPVINNWYKEDRWLFFKQILPINHSPVCACNSYRNNVSSLCYRIDPNWDKCNQLGCMFVICDIFLVLAYLWSILACLTNLSGFNSAFLLLLRFPWSWTNHCSNLLPNDDLTDNSLSVCGGFQWVLAPLFSYFRRHNHCVLIQTGCKNDGSDAYWASSASGLLFSCLCRHCIHERETKEGGVYWEGTGVSLVY